VHSAPTEFPGSNPQNTQTHFLASRGDLQLNDCLPDPP
jgi:hypothetical protein